MAGKKGKGLVIGIVVGLLVLGGGGFAAMAAMGKVPFLAKKGKTPPVTYGEGKEPSKAKPLTEHTAEAKPAATTADPAGTKPDAPAKKPVAAVEPPDPVKGAKKIASVWNNMETADLVKIAKAYPQAELPLILTRMEAEKAAELLAGLDPATAAKLSQEMAKIAGAPSKAL
ncbi:MAG: hypothetical protein KF857_05625 [Fimbriimonadaceae bacterium]|nr:hypothetical protein [Fimbriimonadaceae bacterium]